MAAKKTIIAILLAIGLIAICGEPTQDFGKTIAIQLIIFAATWGTASVLAKKWGIIK